MMLIREDRQRPSDQSRPHEITYLSRVWLDSPTRWRHELTSDRGDDRTVVVVDAPRWSCVLSGGRALSNTNNPAVDPAPEAFPYDGLFKPGELMDGLEIRDRRVGVWRGRRAETFTTTPDGDLHPDLPSGADRYELTLDTEYQVVRHVSAIARGTEFGSIDVPELQFDVLLSSDLFVLDVVGGPHV